MPNQEALYKDPTEGWISPFGCDFCSLLTLPCMWQGDGLLGLLWSCSVSRGQQPPGSQRSELLGLQLCQHYCVSPAALRRSPPGHWAAGTGSSGVWVGVHTHELNLVPIWASCLPACLGISNWVKAGASLLWGMSFETTCSMPVEILVFLLRAHFFYFPF